MPVELIYGAAGVAAYLLGAVPSGYLLVKAKTGRDIRTMGSGNIGATNVARTLGARWFIPVFGFDFLKGFAPVFWAAPWLAARWPCGHCPAPAAALAVFLGLCALVGHMWPVYLGFRGGKGVATVGGILFALNFAAALVAMAVWVVVFLPSRYVSLGSIAGALALPFANHFTADVAARRWESKWPATVFLALAALLVIWRHKGNLQRLLAGTEKRLGRKAA